MIFLLSKSFVPYFGMVIPKYGTAVRKYGTYIPYFGTEQSLNFSKFFS